MIGFPAVLVLAAVLFTTPTESKWTVTKGGAAVGNVTLLTGRTGVRAEFRATPKSPVVVFLGSNDKVWVRESGGDVELSAYKGTGAEKSILPALLYTDAKAKYAKDAKGVSQVDVNGYVLKRTTLAASTADASNFAIRPRKGAATRLAGLSGGLLGSSKSTVSATAGGRGVGTKGLKLADGGDYAAVEAIENRDAAWSENLGEALAEFQKEGKVGKGREQ
jgi:hypothetical protein